MSDILLILCVLYLLKALLTTSLIPNKWVWLGFAAVCAGFVWISHGWALEQNKLALERMLEGQKILTDISIVVMADLLLTLAFSRSALDRSVGIPQKRLSRVMGCVPPLLMFPVLYYAQVGMFFGFVGIDFSLLTGVLSAAVLVVVAGGTLLVRRLLPDPDLRIELTGLLELFIVILAISCTIFHPSTMMYTHDSPVEWRTLMFTAGIVVSLFAVGYGWNLLKPRFRKKDS